MEDTQMLLFLNSSQNDLHAFGSFSHTALAISWLDRIYLSNIQVW